MHIKCMYVCVFVLMYVYVYAQIFVRSPAQRNLAVHLTAAYCIETYSYIHMYICAYKYILATFCSGSVTRLKKIKKKK